jgi:glycosyl transferase family 87
LSLAARRACGIALVVLGAVYVAWLGFRLELMGDYPMDYAPAMNELLGGHLVAFLAHLPTNGAGGSVLLRAPAALLGKLIGGSQLAEFRFGALFCMLVVGGLGLWLARDLREAGRPTLARACVIAVCVLSPAVLDAIFFGHPEEPLGAALCVAAVLVADDGRSGLAGLLLGLAMINKPWGVLALAPVLLAARERTLRVLLIAAAICVAWTTVAYLGAPSHFGRIVFGASTSVVAHPVDLWWPLAHLHLAPGVTPAYFPPPFVSAHARELAVLLMLPLSLPLLRRVDRSAADCLALLALLFLLRCLLDPSNHVYYQIPLVVALAAWEARSSRAPVLALGATGGFWLVFHTISGTGSLSAQFVSYLLVVTPLALVLATAVYRGRLCSSASLWRGRSALGWAR